MKYLLFTGGAGFIGSNAIQYFLTHYPAYTIINLDKLTYAGSWRNMTLFKDHPRHIFIQGDIVDKMLLEKIFSDYPISGVIHFAAESHVDNSIADPTIFINTNVVGTFTLLEIARKSWQGKPENRFHHISTDEVYGSLGETGSFTENFPYRPNSPYSASKASSDHLVRSFFKTYGLNTVVTNCSNNYGPHQHTEKLIPTIIRKALAKEAIPIYGQGTNIRDWLFVEDHCQAIDRVYHQAQPGSYFNIGGNCEMSNIDLANMICHELNTLCPAAGFNYSSLIQFVSDRAGHDFRYAVSIDKIKAHLGWQPAMPFLQGLQKTIASYLPAHKNFTIESLLDPA